MQPTNLTSAGSTRTNDVPFDIADEVELWAREQGRHGKLVWNQLLQCHEVQLSLKGDDPRMRAYQEGKLRKEPVESVFLHRQETPGGHFIGMNIQDLGSSGIRSLLDKGNLLSGRGEFRDLYQAVKAVDDQNQALEDLMAKEADENSRANARDHRRQLFDLPLVPVTKNLEK
ncbi:MAG: hypothetical protein KAJ55_00335 [Anaerolineales bacterium]|nr:hypothetical protein [Anaerolineales bacterium]